MRAFIDRQLARSWAGPALICLALFVVLFALAGQTVERAVRVRPAAMKRSASLDFLRGAAAFAVAVPHYLTANAPFSPAIESVAVAAVEVFFVLSGFVLAPQIVDWVVGRPWRNLGVFLARRWMRTIPPYVAALVVVAADDRQSLHRRHAPLSLLRREPVPVGQRRRLLSGRLEPRGRGMVLSPVRARCCSCSDGRSAAATAGSTSPSPILFVLVVAALRAFDAPPDWDLNVRRVTLFRIDSIVWGFLLYLALERRRAARAEGRRGPARSSRSARRSPLAAALEFGVAMLALEGAALAQQIFPYASALFGVAAVGFFREADGLFRGPRIAALSFYLGRISYSAYLFHIVIVMALKPLVGGWPLLAQLALYVAAICAFSTLFWRGFERPMLAARPDYSPRRGSRVAPATRGPTPKRAEPRRRLRVARRSACAFLAAAVAGAQRLHGERALSLLSGAGRRGASSRSRSPSAPGGLRRGFGVAARAFVLFALALPAADAVYRSSTGRADRRLGRQSDLFLPRRAREPGRVRDVVVLLPQRMDPRRRHSRRRSRSPTRRRSSRSCSRRELGPHVRHHDPHQFGRVSRAGDRADKGDRFRIVALGESQTFGPTLRDGEKPWPEQLQDWFARALRAAARSR